MNGEPANRKDLLNAVWTELNLGREEVNPLVLIERAVDESRLNDTSLTLSSLEQALGETGTCHGHGEGGRASTVLGLDDLVSAELDAVDQVVKFLAGNVSVAGLGD